jgi:hypothetical protein
MPTKPNFEHMLWNQKAFPKAKFRRDAFAEWQTGTIPQQLDERGYLHTEGDKGHLLIGPVYHDKDKNWYRRVDRDPKPRIGEIYGSIKLLRSGINRMKKAELVSEKELINRALAFHAVTRDGFIRVHRPEDRLELHVAMLCVWPTKGYSCGIYCIHEEVQVLNPERCGRWTKRHAYYEKFSLDRPQESAFKEQLIYRKARL